MLTILASSIVIFSLVLSAFTLGIKQKSIASISILVVGGNVLLYVKVEKSPSLHLKRLSLLCTSLMCLQFEM